VAVQRDREERNEEDPREVALRVYDPRIGARRPVRVEPDREPDAQLVRQQRDGDEVDGDHGEKREEHLADEQHKGISFCTLTLFSTHASSAHGVSLFRIPRFPLASPSMVTAEVTERQAHRQRDKALQLGRELDERLDGKPAMALVGRLLEGKRNPGPNALRRSRTLSAGSQRRASIAYIGFLAAIGLSLGYLGLSFPEPCLGISLVEAAEGCAVFEASPAEWQYNQLATVHGRMALRATRLSARVRGPKRAARRSRFTNLDCIFGSCAP
jgi:hypothetical protein